MKNTMMILLLILFLFSCEEVIDESLTSTSDEDSTVVSENPGEQGTFKLEVVKASTADTHILHKVDTATSNFETECSISGQLDKNNPTIIQCALDVEESNLYFSGFTVKFSATEGYCEGVSYRPFTFFRKMPGSSTIGTGTYTKHVCNGCEGNGCNPNLTGVPDLVAACTYNHENDSGDAYQPNCDNGNLTVDIVTYNDTDNDGICDGPTILTSEEVSCGGNPAACISGPILDISEADPLIGQEGVLYRDTDQASTGMSQNISVAAPFDGGFKTNLNIANYKHECNDGSSNEDYSLLNLISQINTDFPTPAENSNLEAYAVNALNGKFYSDKTGVMSPNPFYTFICRDHAYDPLAIIYLSVRDFDRDFTNGESFLALPTEGTLQNYDSGIVNSLQYQFNHFDDWDDKLRINGACGETIRATSGTYFPGDAL